MKYILILYIGVFGAGGLTTAEFNNWDACNIALNKAKEKSDVRTVTGICVKKGLPQSGSQ